MENKVAYSVVIPIFNEEENIRELYARLKSVLEKISLFFEVIFIDDGSTDRSFLLLKEMNKNDSRIKAIIFSRNYGHHMAITAGLDYAQGDAIILMDGDLQDPPEEIPVLWEKFQEGYDIVYGIRKQRADSLYKRLTSKTFHKLFRILTKVELDSNSGIYRMISRRVVETLKSFRERSRFIIALMSWIGFPSAGVKINRDKRYAGRTKYNFFKSANLAMDGITSFSSLPLRIAIYVGFLMASVSLATGIYMLIRKYFFGFPVMGYASIIVSILFLGGIQLLILGIIGEYISRIYAEVKDRPLYIIEKKLGID